MHEHHLQAGSHAHWSNACIWQFVHGIDYAVLMSCNTLQLQCMLTCAVYHYNHFLLCTPKTKCKLTLVCCWPAMQHSAYQACGPACSTGRHEVELTYPGTYTVIRAVDHAQWQPLVKTVVIESSNEVAGIHACFHVSYRLHQPCNHVTLLLCQAVQYSALWVFSCASVANIDLTVFCILHASTASSSLLMMQDKLHVFCLSTSFWDLHQICVIAARNVPRRLPC